METNIKGRSLLTLKDFSASEIRFLIDMAHEEKKERNVVSQRFKGKSLALLFEKRSTRTRCAFETAFGEEGGCAVFLSTQDIHLGEKESIEDTSRVLGRMFDAIQFRGYSQKTAEILASYSGVPVYNGLTDSFHPTQILADFMTIEEEFENLESRELAYIGDGRNNVARSLMVGCAKLGLNCSVVAPRELFPEEEHFDYCIRIADKNGANLRVGSEIQAGVEGADAVYTDVWISLGEESKEQERLRMLQPYQVSGEVMEQTGNPDAIFLHCLPAVRGNEVVHEVLEGSCSRVWDQAENRKHTIKALMLATL